MKKKLIVGAIFCLSVVAAGASTMTVNTSCGVRRTFTCDNCTTSEMIAMAWAIEAAACGDNK